MITTETLTINGVEHVKHVSDSGYYIQCVETGEQYTEAVDPADAGRTYTETETAIPEPKEQPENPMQNPMRFKRS